MAREVTTAALVLVAVLAALPAYARPFTGGGWRASLALAAVLAVALAAGVRRLRRGAITSTLVSLTALAVLLPWLTGVTERPVLPRPEVLDALRQGWAQGLLELVETPAPTPILPGLLLISTVAFWVTAHAAHELTVRARRPGAALVATAVLWAAPLVVPLPPGRTWPHAVPFLAAAAMVLLATARWPSDDAGPAPLPASGIVAAALVIAVAAAVPGLLPGYGERGWMPLGAASEPRGYQPIVDISERLRLPEERDVLRVQASHRTYLRLAGLDGFDGFTWRLGEPGTQSYRPAPESLVTATGRLPFEVPAAETEPVFVDVEVLALENIYVPVPYQPVEVLGPHRDGMVWSTEGGFLATWDTTDVRGGGGPRVGLREGISYRVEAARPVPTFAQLAAVEPDPADHARHTELPRTYPALREQADAVYAAAGASTTIERVLALQDWFTGPAGGFTYDLDVPALRDDGALERFVLEDKLGYCEYFATAMAVMLRETGIPARVAVGFLPGRVTLDADPDAGRELTEFTVSTADAHAWVEVLFPGYGWITFEPTPRSDQTQIVPTAEDLAPVENLRERQQRELRERIGELPEGQQIPEATERPGQPMPPPGADGGATPGEDPGGGIDTPWPLTLAVGAVAVAAIAAVGWRRRRSRPVAAAGSAAEEVVRAQRQLLTTARRYGIGRARHETIRELVSRWEAEGRIDERGRRFARTAQAAAFGGEVDQEVARASRQLVRDLEGMLKASLPRRERAVAPLRVPLHASQELTARVRDRLRRRLRGAATGARRVGPRTTVPTRAASTAPARRSGSRRTAG